MVPHLEYILQGFLSGSVPEEVMLGEGPCEVSLDLLLEW